VSTFVTYKRESDNEDVFTLGAKSLPELRIDYTSLTKEERNSEHMGARLVLCAALACFTNTFANAMINEGAKINSMSATATIEKEKDDTFRTHYTNILIQLEVGVDDADAPVFERVRSNMINGSLLTYSLDEGIEMDYDISRA